MKHIMSLLLLITCIVSANAQSIELVKNIRTDDNTDQPLFSGSRIGNLTTLNNAIYFGATDGTTFDLWTSDGTENGTLTIPYPEVGVSVSDIINYNGATYYLKHSGIYPNYENWFLKIGTNLEVTEVLPNLNVKDILGVYFGKIFLVVIDAATGTEIWTSDGTAEGTTLLKDINPNADASSNAASVQCIEHNGTLYFAKDDNGSPQNVELWKTDGTEDGTVKVKEINTETGTFQSSSPSSFFVLNNEVYFLAYSPQEGGTGLWKTDGTESGTVFISLFTSTWFTRPVIFNGHCYIGTWRTDGTQQGSGFYTDNTYTLPLIVYNNRLLFAKYTSIAVPFSSTYSLYSTDGTEDGTIQLLEADGERGFYGGLQIIQAEIVDGRVYFLASKYETNYVDYGYLWATDGTPEGTQLLTPSSGSDIYNYYYNENEVVFRGGPIYGKSFTVNNDEIYFAGMFEAEIGYELYKMQPLPPPTVSTDEINTIKNELTVFPNPASDQLHVSLTNDKIAHVSIYDVSGKCVDSYFIGSEKSTMVSINKLQAGIYTMNITTASGSKVVRRFIKA